MSLEMMVWALRKDLGNSEFKAMIYIANEAGSDGVCYTGQKKLAALSGLGERTLRRSISKLREMDLLHTERRPAEFARGRKMDAIILHPENSDHELPVHLKTADEINEYRRLRKEYETFDDLVDNLPEDQPVKMAGRYKVTSQSQPVKMAGKSFNRPKQDVQPAKMSSSTGQNEHLETGPLKRNARAFNPFNPVNPSSSSPEELNTSTPVENSGAEEDDAKINPSPVIPADPPKVTHGVPHQLLRKKLEAHLGTNLSYISEELLADMVQSVFKNTHVAVRHPLNYTVACIAKDFHMIYAVAVTEQEKRATKSRNRPSSLSPAPQPHLRTCPTHNVEYYDTTECSCCRSEKIGR